MVPGSNVKAALTEKAKSKKTNKQKYQRLQGRKKLAA